MSTYGNVTSLSESPLVEGLLYAGTDDGLIHVSEDGGRNWSSLDKLPGVPDFFFVNDIKADLFNPDTVYVVVDDHKSGDFSPYVLKSTNRGRSWRSIAGDLPERHVVWRLVQDHVNPGLLFLGTEFGVFFSVEGGNQWVKLSGGTPNIPFRDLVIQKRENDLVGATFGRGFYVLDDYSVLRDVNTDMLENETVLFPVRDARWYVPKRPLGCDRDDCRSSQGGAYFVAPNPPFGATFTYYLPEQIRTRQEQRREREKPLEQAGEDTPYPGWDALQTEALEDEPAIVLTVKDADGNVVRRVEGPVTAGLSSRGLGSSVSCARSLGSGGPTARVLSEPGRRAGRAGQVHRTPGATDRWLARKPRSDADLRSEVDSPTHLARIGAERQGGVLPPRRRTKPCRQRVCGGDRRSRDCDRCDQRGYPSVDGKRLAVRGGEFHLTAGAKT